MATISSEFARSVIATKPRAANPIEGHPWITDGKYFPLGPNTEIKADWEPFWMAVEMCKLVLKQVAAGNVSPPSKEGMTAEKNVIDLKANCFTSVLSAVYCPGWSITWALSLLNLIWHNASRASLLMLVAVKGGPACDEEIAFIGVLMAELGLRPDAWRRRGLFLH